jgi:putative ABC transport system ATP-binding protein
LNVKENILLPARLFGRSQSWIDSQKECDELMEKLDMTEFAEVKPAQLSLGQQQRVAQARALIGKPELIVADEPTSSLDEKNTAEFMKLLINSCEKKNISLLFVSHDLRLEKYFDKSISLKNINEVQS